MDAQTPYGAMLAEVFRWLQGKRIVEIPGIGRVDGEHHAIADIAIPRRKSAHFIENRRIGLRQGSFREHGFKLGAGDDGFNGNGGVVGHAEHFLDNAASGLMPRWVCRHANAHKGAVRDIGGIGAHGKNIVRDVMVLGHHHAERLGNLIAPHDGIVRSVDDAQHARRRPIGASAVGRAAGRKRRHFHQVAVESPGHLRFRDEVFPFCRPHEAERPRMDH